MEKKAYRLGVGKKPGLTNKQFLAQKLYALPFVSGFFEKRVKRELGLEQSVSITRGFLCATPNLSVGKDSGLSDLYIHGVGDVRIGKHCSISKGCTIITESHDLIDFGINTVYPVCLDDYSWVAYGATILPGVTIGRGAIVGAKAVVTKDVAPYTIVAGNPARFIKYRMSIEEIKAFEKEHFPEDERMSDEALQGIIKTKK